MQTGGVGSVQDNVAVAMYLGACTFLVGIPNDPPYGVCRIWDWVLFLYFEVTRVRQGIESVA
jgi:hypothetical protein